MFSARVAIQNQYACNTIVEADKAFQKSCDMCCMSPSCYMDCDHCRVAEAHKFIVERMKSEIKVGGDEDGEE